MRRIAALLVLTVIASLLAGCVYDPYTGTYIPCCSYYHYPYPYYRYPYYPYGYPPGPYMMAPQTQPGAYPNAPPAGPGATNYPRQGDELAQRFAAANATHDGRLTREQAASGMPVVTQNFDAIDIDRKGYVTLPEVRAFLAQHGAELGQPGQSGIP